MTNSGEMTPASREWEPFRQAVAPRPDGGFWWVTCVPGPHTELILHDDGRALWHRRETPPQYEESDMPVGVVQESSTSIRTLMEAAAEGRKALAPAGQPQPDTAQAMSMPPSVPSASPNEPQKLKPEGNAGVCLRGDTTEVIFDQEGDGTAYWRPRATAERHTINLPRDVVHEAAASIEGLIDKVDWMRRYGPQ